LDRDPVQTWGRGRSAEYLDRLRRFSFLNRDSAWDEWREEE
jgi:hypothetical protein